MLEEWIRNVPLSLLRQIIADPKARGSVIWALANEELFRRAQDALAA
jgi:hypothetical protein